MDLINDTDFEAELIHGPQGPEDHGIAVIVKATFPLAPSGLADGAPPFVWPVSRKDLETDYGKFPFDHHFPLSRMDMMVCGDACVPKGKTTREMGVMLNVGQFEYVQQVFGDRRWRKHLTGYRASDPEPFQRMPMTLANAYGGKIQRPYGEFACQDNPDGKGFLLEGDPAEDVALPNIERPEERLRRPYESVRPTCMAPYPLAGKLRYVSLVENGAIRPFDPNETHLYFGQAHPDLMLARPEPGTAVRLKGMHPDHDLTFQIPENGFEAAAEIDGETVELSISLDGLCIFAHHMCVGFKYRAAAAFRLEPRQERRVILRRKSL